MGSNGNPVDSSEFPLALHMKCGDVLCFWLEEFFEEFFEFPVKVSLSLKTFGIKKLKFNFISFLSDVFESK